MIMASEARLGYGTLLQRNVTGTWTTVAEQVSLGGPSLSSEDVEVTNHDSPNSAKEYIPALTDTGQITFDGNFIPDSVSQQVLLTDQKNRVVADWRLVLPTADDIEDRIKWSFQGYVQSLDFDYPTQDKMTINGVIKLAGGAELSTEQAAYLTGLVIMGVDSSNDNTLALDEIPDLADGVLIYFAEAAAGDVAVKITPTCSAADKIEVNGVEVGSGDPSGIIPINSAVETVVVTVRENGKTPTVYQINVIEYSE